MYGMQAIMADPLLSADNFPMLGAARCGMVVAKVGATWDNANMCLSVTNTRFFGIPKYDTGLFLQSAGEVTESVTNVHTGTRLKGDTVHSSWSKRRAPTDKHAIPLSQIAKLASRDGDAFTGKLIIGKTVALQLFLYKSTTVVTPMVFPRSGFKIEYLSEVYSAGGEVIPGMEVLVPPDSGVYAILTISKRPAKVTVGSEQSDAGSGAAATGRWKISRAPNAELSSGATAGALEWKVETL